MPRTDSLKNHLFSRNNANSVSEITVGEGEYNKKGIWMLYNLSVTFM